MKKSHYYVLASIAQVAQGMESANANTRPDQGFALLKVLRWCDTKGDLYCTENQPDAQLDAVPVIPNHLSNLGVQFLGHLEDVRLKPYDDLTGRDWDGVSEPQGHLAIGFGRTLFDDMYTEADMQRWLHEGASPDEVKAWMAEDIVEPEVRVRELQDDRMHDLKQPSFQQHQFDALVCFVYNIGSGAFTRSTLRRKLLTINKDMCEAMREELPRWKYSRGTIPSGLPKRRQETIELFCSGDYVPGWFTSKAEARAIEEQMAARKRVAAQSYDAQSALLNPQAV